MSIAKSNTQRKSTNSWNDQYPKKLKNSSVVFNTSPSSCKDVSFRHYQVSAGNIGRQSSSLDEELWKNYTQGLVSTNWLFIKYDNEKSSKVGCIEAIEEFLPFNQSILNSRIRNRLNLIPDYYLKTPELHIIETLASPKLPVAEDVNNEMRFPSTQLAQNLLNGVAVRAKSYQNLGITKDELIANEHSLKVSDFKDIIDSALKQTISTISSIAAQKNIEKFKISEGESLTVIFEDLLKQYLPPISSEAFCSIGPILIKELINELNFKEYVVDSGKLLFEKGDLLIQVEPDYSLPGLLISDESDFLVASDI